MKNGRLYGVGVGPGDKELITLKAVRILEYCDVIAVPIMKSGEKTAFKIVQDYIKNKKIIDCCMPMSKDFDKLSENYSLIADNIENELKKGLNTAFITLGDPTVYSTYMQINSIMLSRGYETELVSGVTSFCAAAARLNIPLCERDEPLLILPASYAETEQRLDFKGTKVLMKASRSMGKIKNALKEKGLDGMMVECCGMENERVYTSLDDIDENAGYFSVVIVK